MKSKYWTHFEKGETDSEGEYDAICKYCGEKKPMGKQRGTSGLKHHFTKQCKKVPASIKNDKLQQFLTAGQEAGNLFLYV